MVTHNVLSLLLQRKYQRKETTGPQPPPATRAGPDGPPATASGKLRAAHVQPSHRAVANE